MQILTAHNTSTTLTAPRLTFTLTAHPIDVSGTVGIQWVIQSEDVFDLLDSDGVTLIMSDAENTPAGFLTAPRIR